MSAPTRSAAADDHTLSLHDALPICPGGVKTHFSLPAQSLTQSLRDVGSVTNTNILFDPLLLKRSEEHTSELQSQSNLVCRLLLEKKKNETIRRHEVVDAVLELELIL